MIGFVIVFFFFETANIIKPILSQDAKRRHNKKYKDAANMRNTTLIPNRNHRWKAQHQNSRLLKPTEATSMTLKSNAKQQNSVP
jgi:hypothetical protein